MKVLIDTVIWSQALRKTVPQAELAQSLSSLIADYRAVIIGPIRQELLSGYSNLDQFKKLKEKLHYFPNEPILDEDYLKAAEFNNTCRKKGIQGSHIDFLICAVSIRIKSKIWTIDKDFHLYAKHLPINLY